MSSELVEPMEPNEPHPTTGHTSPGSRPDASPPPPPPYDPDLSLITDLEKGLNPEASGVEHR